MDHPDLAVSNFLENSNGLKRVTITAAAIHHLLLIQVGQMPIIDNIGITHVFSCINICRVPRKVFEHEVDRPSAQTSPEGPGKC